MVPPVKPGPPVKVNKAAGPGKYAESWNPMVVNGKVLLKVRYPVINGL
jgi:hypothetical protein